MDLERGCSRARLDLNAPVSFCPSLFRRLVEDLYLSDALILHCFFFSRDDLFVFAFNPSQGWRFILCDIII